MLKKWILIFSLVLSLGLVWAQGSEDFTNSTATATYADNSFVGNGGVTWTFGHSRDQGDYPIDGNGLMLRRASDSYLQATIPGGIGNFSFQYKKAFTGTSARQLELYVNDVVVGTTDVFGTTDPEPDALTFLLNNINTTGDVTVKIKNVGSTTTNRQAVIDNIVWTGYVGGGDPPAAIPEFSPAAGTYQGSVLVSISSPTPGAVIYYTLNGDNPTDMSTQYTSAFQLTQTTTVKAIAYATGYLPSSVATASYVVESPNFATIPYTQTFDADLGDTYNYSVSGPSKTWYQASGVAAINGFNSGDIEEDWLILPGLNMNTNSHEVMSFDTWRRYGVLGVDNYLKLYYSTNYTGIGDPTTASWTEITFAQPATEQTWTSSGMLDLSGITGTSVFFALKYYSVPGNYTSWNVDNISIINLPPNQPLLVVNPPALSGFSYIEGDGPSAAQMFSVSGTNLTANVVLQAPANYEISTNETSGFTSTITLTQIGGSVAETPLYARLEAGLGIAAYNDELITVNSSGAAEVTVTLSGSVTGPLPYAQVIQRPAQISLADATHQSAVLVQVANYPIDDARYRLYNGANQYNPWRADTEEWVSSSSYSAGPQAPGTPSSSVTWWIPFQRGNNINTAASYRDRLGPSYGSNYQTAALPAATAITNAVPILKSQVTFNTWNDYTQKYIVLAYDAAETLIAASSTDLVDGAFTVWVENGTSITRIEIRDVMNNLIEAVTGTWPQILNPQITLTGTLDPLYNIQGMPSEEIGQYTVVGQDLTGDISVVAPTHFEIADNPEGPWASTLSLASNYNGLVYVRINSTVIGAHSGDITHNSTGATEATIRVEGETLEPLGVINVTSTMTAFTQTVGSPSATQSYSVSGSGLSTDITITAGAPFEVSQNGTSAWAGSISIPGTYNGLIYVRLNSDVVGNFNNIEIMHENANASPVSIYVSGTANPPAGVLEDLFFSEYLEGSSNNKAIEIFNAHGAPVDLSRYQVELYSNGSATPGNTLVLSGILAPGDVYVIANASAAAEILAVADITSTVTFFNGDDALALRCLNPDVIIDVFGQIGTDPGTGWAVAGVANATVDHTLIRKATVTTGNTDWAAQFGTNEEDSEWIVMPNNYFDDLGTHTFNPGGGLDMPLVTIVQNGTNVELSWNVIDGASSYRVESSDDPYAGFTTVGTTANTFMSISAAPGKKFFRVIALP